MTTEQPGEERMQKANLLTAAAQFVVDRKRAGKKEGEAGYPLNGGDILLLIMLIDRELLVAPSDPTDPLNAKRLAAIREKLGNFAIDAPHMSKEEARQFRE